MTDFLEQPEDVVENLIEKAEVQGYLTMDEVLEAFPDPEERLDQVEEVFLRLNEAGIEVYDDKADTLEPTLEAEAFSADSAEAAAHAQIDLDMFDLSGISSDDTVGLYLK